MLIFEKKKDRNIMTIGQQEIHVVKIIEIYLKVRKNIMQFSS